MSDTNLLSKQIPQDAQQDDVATNEMQFEMLKQTTYYFLLLFPAIAVNESCSRFREHTRLQKSTWMILKFHHDYQLTELDSDNLLNDRNNVGRNVIDQRFYEMNRQIGELTDLVLALTLQISSNHREGNGFNMAKPSANGHSDTGIHSRHLHSFHRDVFY